jgi:hypothetical protein
MKTQEESQENTAPLALWVRVLAVLVGLGVIAVGVYMAVTGTWVYEDHALAEGVPARVVGAMVATIGVVSLVRSAYRWAKPR